MSDMKGSLTTLLLIALCLTIHCLKLETTNDTKTYALNPWVLEQALTTGDSLKGTTIKGLQTGRYNVEASGAVENYSKWPLLIWTCESAAGYITKQLLNVLPGVIEGFASRKASDTAKGTWVRCSLVVDDDIMVHFMYSAPYSFDLHSNWLSVAVCAKRSTLCRSMNAKKMYYNTYSFMDRKEYKDNMYPAKICYDNVCMTGSMLRNHHPTIRIKIYPKSYHNLNSSIKKKAIGIDAKEYEEFMKSIVS